MRQSGGETLREEAGEEGEEEVDKERGTVLEVLRS